VAVGFGVKTQEHARTVARIADGVVVGSAIVSLIGAKVGGPKDRLVAAVLELCRALADSTHAARAETV
jgi:tryptophan synthase alpha chain